MRCLFIGICQLVAIAEMLESVPEFTSLYSVRRSYAVFSLSEQEMRRILDEELPAADLVVTQPVSSSYKNNPMFSTEHLRARAPSGCRFVVIPNCYFTGYDPLPFQMTEGGQVVHRSGVSYLPGLAVAALMDGNVPAACCAVNAPSAFSKEQLQRNYERSIGELRQREQDMFGTGVPTDVRIADFIADTYRAKHLFHTYNHPTNALLKECMRRILDLARVRGTLPEYPRELLGDCSLPPVPAVYEQMQMTFPYPPYVVNQRPMNTYEAMAEYARVVDGASANKEAWTQCVEQKRACL